MKGLNLFWRFSTVFNGIADFPAIQIMANANDHESQLASVANECQSKESVGVPEIY